jgi:hypothetical protein
MVDGGGPGAGVGMRAAWRLSRIVPMRNAFGLWER